MQSNNFIKLCLLTALGILISHAQLYAQPALERINAIYASLAGDHAALYVAQAMGLFRKYGLEVNLSYTAGAAQVIQTMMAGELWAAIATEIPAPVTAHESHLNISTRRLSDQVMRSPLFRVRPHDPPDNRTHSRVQFYFTS